MKRLALLLVLVPALTSAQVFIGRQVIGAAALSGTGSILMDATVGQVETATLQVDSLTLTQGFQQPDQHPLTLGVALEWPGCNDGSGGTLTLASIGGCASGTPLIFWDGELLEGNQVTGLESGTYQLQIISGPNCTLSIDYTVVAPELPGCALEFFNTITPNNDQQNDVWVIENIASQVFDGNTVQVFDRWGAEVWSATGYNNTNVVFDGSNQDGHALSAGTYYYLVTVQEQQFTGFIELVR